MEPLFPLFVLFYNTLFLLGFICFKFSANIIAWQHQIQAPKFKHMYEGKYGTKKSLETTLKAKTCTGKSVPEAFILESVNPQYDVRLSIDLRLQ